ncbi:hypothetical protein OG455_22040 [Kitasatospora sp. NBC_01287]|uniref:hypothetical protein n=1 Tax=Kitasatospora sp. NBC_01287 TaxID=2903573 RepID=UPI00225B2C9A|nr:hypothetical protein [Kitasatospora sp. NBC_01287]MCX4748159.1 hypothetical protein [Kitasatospora sp. NBC_01287]
MATTHPTAAPGYGKRSAPSQHPLESRTFAHLPEREAYLAAFLDRLPDGAAVDAKTLAAAQPRFGQQAVRSALRHLARLGHLLRIRETVGEGVTRWVSRTYFSRTARAASWWERFLTDRRTGGSADPSPAPPARSFSYRALASLAAADRRMMLSARECEELEALAAEWFARGVTVEQFRFALTNGLPASVQCPGAFARRRLLDRVPPEPAPAPVRAPVRAPVPEPPLTATHQQPHRATCRTCHAAGPPGSLREDGFCPKCRDRGHTATLIAGIRATMRERPRP